MGTTWPTTASSNVSTRKTRASEVSPHMNTLKQIDDYITAQPEPKRGDMVELHRIILTLMPNCKLWFLDGRDRAGKVISNPNIGYGAQAIKYADGKTKDFYQIGMSANTTGISIYILGIEDKKYLAQKFGKELGKATITGYCIKFRRLEDVRTEVLEAAIRYGVERSRI